MSSAPTTHTRIAYETFQKTAPSAQAALLAMGKAADETGLDKTIIELVKLRVSQINNCAFCLQIHLNVSRRLACRRRSSIWSRPGTRPASSRSASARRWPGRKP